MGRWGCYGQRHRWEICYSPNPTIHNHSESMRKEVNPMSQLDKLHKKLNDPAFAKAYAKNKSKAIEDAIGRPLAAHEKAAVKELSHNKLTKVVTALRPRGKGPHE